jgi:hypothetical protein
MTTEDEEVELDEDLAAALAEEEQDNDNDLTGERAIEERAEVAAEVAAIRAEISPPRKNKGGRPKKKAMGDIPPTIPISPASTKPRDRDLMYVWNNIVKAIEAKGFGGPEGVTIAIKRFATGANRVDPMDLNPIQGATVGGSTTRTPGEDLYDYIVRAYHVPAGAGPSIYRCRFSLKISTDNFLGVADLTLPAAADIRRQWEAEAQLKRDREREADFGKIIGGPPLAAPWQPQVQTPPHLSGAPPYPTSSPSAPTTDPTLLQWVMAQYERERRENARLGVPPPPPPPIALPVAGPPVISEDFESRVARTVVQTLQAMGITPQAAGLGAAPSAQPGLTPGAVTTAVTTPMDAAKAFFQQMREFKQMDAQMREMFAPEEEEEETPTAAAAQPTVIVPEADEDAMKPINETFARFDGDPIIFGKQKEGEGMVQYIIRLSTANPKIAGALLEKGAKVLDQGSFGKLMTAFTQMGGPQAHAAGQLAGAQLSGGQAPQAQTNGAAAGWKPSVG